jgi:hypothetical protein
MLLTCGEQLPPPSNFRASRHSYSPSARPVTVRRASGNGRSALPATGKGSRVVSVLGIVVPMCNCMGLFLSFRREPSPRLSAIRKEGMVALGRVVFTSREHVIALEPRGKGLLGVTLRYPYEVRKEDEYFDDIADEKIPKDMLELAAHIVETKGAISTPKNLRTTMKMHCGSC